MAIQRALHRVHLASEPLSDRKVTVDARLGKISLAVLVFVLGSTAVRCYTLLAACGAYSAATACVGCVSA